VSNLPIKEGDRAVALQHCWRLIERANYGYDFGGYRDGILSLRGQLGDLTALALLNDSTWFPLPGGRDWLAEAESLHVAFAGAASNFGAARVPVSDYQRIAWRYSSDHKNFHHCSFALLLSQPALGDPRLLEFWQSFRLSRDKKRTVRRGEIGLTQWMIRHGYSHADTLDIAALDADLKDLPEARIVEILNRLIIPEDERLFAAKHSVLEDADLKTEGWRDRAEGFILTAVARQGISYALAEFITKERKFPFLKKSPVWLNPEASDITLQLALDLKGEFADTVVSEIKALRKRNR
jgi:lipopolysaccharide biosynthesis protein